MPDIRRLTPEWRWEDGSVDRCRILEGWQGWRVDGRHDDLMYQIATDAEHRCTRLHISAVANRQPHALILTRDEAGWRTDAGDLILGSRAAVDLDLSWTALTNTFPIKRLIAAGKDHGTFDVLWIKAPEVPPTLARQSYTRTDAGWRYHNETSGFTATLTVDTDGLVIDYPGVCTLEGPAE